MNRKQRRIAESQGSQAPDTQALLQQAVALHKSGKLAETQALYEAVLKIDPKNFDALHYSGVLAAQTQNLQRAADLIGEAIKINPNSAEAYSNRGVILQELKQRDAALLSFDKAVALNPAYAEAYYNRGCVLQELKKWDAALASHERAIALNHNHAQAYCNRGVLFQKLKQWDAARASCERAIAIKPDYAEAYYNLGNALSELGQFAAALAWNDQALALKPDLAEAHSGRGVILQNLKQIDAALASHERALRLKPEYAEGHYSRAFSLLLSGDLSIGFEEYEWRWQSDTFTSPKRNFSQPLWLGKESLAGKTILLHPEQGYGDSIQFCRYVPMVAALGARVILAVPKPLASLLGHLNGLTQLIVEEGAAATFDYHCPLLSLPLAFRTNINTIPAPAKYLSSTPAKLEQWRARIGAKTQPRVGLVWKGSKEHNNDRNRSIALSDLIQTLPSGFQYISLQREIDDADKKILESHPEIFHFGNAIEDFSDTAALCDLMDIVISVDTSVAHLSGALGKPTWILLPFVPDWRWMLDRDDSPWYPSVRLFRQPKAGDWESVFAKVKAALTEKIQAL